MPNNNIVGDKIRFFRNKKGITQKALADLIGKTESSIQKYECGSTEVPFSVLEKIANALDITILFLLDDEYLESASAYFEEEGDSKTSALFHNMASLNKKLATDFYSERNANNGLHKYDDSIRVEITPETLENLKQVNIILEKIENGEQLTENNLQVLKNYIQRQEAARKRLKGTMQTMQEILDRLNEVGQEEAVKRVEELSEIPRYTKPDEPPQE